MFIKNSLHNKSQEWDLSVPDGSKIQLTFNSFDVEYDGSCSYDYVQVHAFVDPFNKNL